MSQNLELAFKQFVSIRETLDKKGVTINIKQLGEAIDQGLDVLAEGIRQVAEPAQRKVVLMTAAEQKVIVVLDDGSMLEHDRNWDAGRWRKLPELPPVEVKTNER